MIAAFIAALAGALSWSLAEYCIHRWLGHDRRLVKNPFGDEHTAHHSRGNYFAPTWKKLAVAIIVTACLIGPATFLAGETVGAGYVLGFVSFYLFYEALHRLEHVHEGIGAYGRWARRHHFYHHFHDPSVNHGVTSPVWDHVFGTYVEAGVIRVPEKLKMDWLCDDNTGDVHPHLTASYQLRRQPAPLAKTSVAGQSV